MTRKQELLIGLTTSNVADLVANLANTPLTVESICEDREKNFLKNLTETEKNDIMVDGEINEDALIVLLETKQFVEPEPEPDYAPYASEQDKVNAEARAYLASTDWYVTRKLETGVEIPADITTAREEARASIVE